MSAEGRTPINPLTLIDPPVEGWNLAKAEDGSIWFTWLDKEDVEKANTPSSQATESSQSPGDI